MVAAGDQCRPGRRAQRGGAELRVTQARIGDAIQRRCRKAAGDDASAGDRRQPRYLPAPLAPCEIIATALSTVSEPDAWLGGYSLKVFRKPPTMATAGTIVQSFSPHHWP